MEFHKGALPNAINIPLLNDQQRELVGTTYKHSGQQAAIKMGHELINDERKQVLLNQWRKFYAQHPQAKLYCFRGGLRSQIVQQWLQETGTVVERIDGGYKAMRQFLIDELHRISTSSRFTLLAGKTGTGKTNLLHQLNNSIDLEKLANHRGSAFGNQASAQPAQINFENQLAITMLKGEKQPANHFFLEDESRGIGSLSIPVPVHDRMKCSPLILIEEDLEFRTNTILHDYIFSNLAAFKAADEGNAQLNFSTYLLSSLEKISKRLGSENYQAVSKLMKSALAEKRSEQNKQLHYRWIAKILTDYYDPMYEYQLEKKSDRVIFTGSQVEFLHWSKQYKQKLQTG